jgi:glycosyltransferase involved in cell wall biosynthesis
MSKTTAVIMPSAGIGGAEQHSAVIATALRRGGDRIHYAIPFSTANEALRSRLVAEGIAINDLDFELGDGGGRAIRFVTRLVKCLLWLRRIRADRVLIFLTWPTSSIVPIAAASLLKAPGLLIFTLVPPAFLIGRWHRKLLLWSLRGGKMGCRAVCAENRQLLVQKLDFPESKVAVVYNGTPIQPDRCRKAKSKDDQSCRILTSGRLCFQKGHDLIVPVIPHLRGEFPGVRFVWLGDFESEWMVKLDAALDSYQVRELVSLPGVTTDVRRELDAADIFLFPTRFEGHSRALVEAMAAGLPIVTSDASGIPEMIRHGVEGLIFRNGDSCDLMEKLRWALRHPEEMRRMGEAARERQKEFTEELMIAGTLACIEKLERGVPLS